MTWKGNTAAARAERQRLARSAIESIIGIYKTPLLVDPKTPTAIFNAAATYVFINLHDLCRFSAEEGHEITVKEPVAGPRVGSFSDLMRELRNAACHVDSGRHNVNDCTQLTWAVLFGRSNRGVIIDNAPDIQNDYDQDVAIYLGPFRFYVHAHGKPALERSIEIFGR